MDTNDETLQKTETRLVQTTLVLNKESEQHGKFGTHDAGYRSSQSKQFQISPTRFQFWCLRW